MTEPNNIERLFQEKLSNFEVTPPDEVWNNIAIELNEKKKKRRVVPFWWKITGIAALLVIGYSVFNSNLSNKSIPNPNGTEVVNKETKSNSSFNPTDSASNENQKGNIKKNPSSIDIGVVGKSNSKENKTIANEATLISSNTQKSNTSENTSSNGKGKTKTTTNQSYFNRIASKEPIDRISDTTDKENTNNTHNMESVAYIINEKNKTTTYNNTKENKTIAEAPKNSTQVEKKAMGKKLDATVNEEVLLKKDSTSIAKVEPNAMEELLQEKEKESTQKQKINRWRITPNLAPIYFGSFDNGSPLDESLANNQKTYNTNMSYGLSVDYAVTKNVKIRSGVHVFSIDYDTQGIVFYQDMKAQMMKNINPTQLGTYIQIKPLNNVSTQLDRIASERFDGVLNQRMGFIEMPLEVTYTLLGTKLGVDVSGGFSTLFLNKNEIYLNADGTNMKIGSATNLNNIHFSTNLGFGLNYAIFKNFDARIEPTFKYQINTFSSDDGSFKPYIFGIYSGISYKF